MQDPTSLKFLKTQRVHRSGLMVGQDRPFGRVTWAKDKLHGVASAKPGVGTVRYLDETAPEEEFFGIRTISTDRSIGQDAATVTITMWNKRPDWAPPEGIDSDGSLGYLSPTRGAPHPVPKLSVFNALDDEAGMFEVGSSIKYPTSWQYNSNRYRDVLIPNTVIRTYQGYGSDNLDQFGHPYAPGDPSYVAPKHDAQLFRTGVWLIDKVTFSADGTVTVEGRDRAKVLIEQYVYPPLIPLSRFPLIYSPALATSGHKESIGKDVGTFHSSSVDAVYGKNHAILGHRGSHAFDSSLHSYWLSGPNTRTGTEWLQARVKGAFNEIVLNCANGHYVVYVSIHEHGKWLGTRHVSGNTENLSPGEGNAGEGTAFFYVITSGDTLWDLAGTYYGDHELWPVIARANNNIIKDPHWIYPGQKIKIPYVKGTLSPPPPDSGTGGTKVNIPYVLKATVPGNGKVTIKLPRTYHGRYVRVVFKKLAKHKDGTYRADCRNMTVRNHIRNTYKPSTIGKASYIQDWVEPIKELLAWAGFTYFDVNQVVHQADTMRADPLLGHSKSGSKWLHQYPSDVRTNSVPLRVWGDFEVLGAGPVVSTPGDYFMNKSFKEAIQLVVDFLGAIFFIDESGGAQFRLPNIWGGGNFVNDPTAPTTVAGYVRRQYPVEFHEDANLTSYSAVISDEALRSEILVVGGYPNIKSNVPIAGGTVLGYNRKTNTTSAIDFSNVLAGQYRLAMVPGESTKLFNTVIECQRMAELIALFILFTYRQGSLTAPAHPGLQLDDQIRIFERVTGESYVHYVSSIKADQDLEAGTFTMNCTTHWLGSDPNTDWFINKQQLTPAVTNLPSILARVGQQAPPDDSLPSKPPAS